MKKLLSLSLAAAMLLALLAGCGGDNAQTSTPADTNESAPVTSGEPSDNGSASTEIEPLTILFSATYQEAETGGQILKYFQDKVSELSGGAVTADIYWGGTLFPSTDELAAVMDGSVNMIALGHMPHLNTITYLAFPGFAPGGTQAALDYFNTLMFDDPETSAIIQGQAEELGIKYLNVIAGGANAFCSRNPFTDLDSLVAGSSAFGNFDAAIFEALGFQVTSVAPPDCYDALNRGLIDATQMGFAPMVSMSWYEVAPYWALDDTYTAGNMFTVNLNWWNGLSDAQREVIQQAADETEAYSATIYDDAIATDIAKVEDATGNPFVEFSQEDKDRIWAATFEAKAESALALVSSEEEIANQTLILEKAAEITNYDWQH